MQTTVNLVAEPQDIARSEVIDSLFQKQRLQETQILDLREQLACVLRDVELLKQSSCEPDGCKSKSGWGKTEEVETFTQSATAGENVATYHFGESMWDAIILVFFRDTSWPSTLLLATGFLFNLTLQVLLLVIIRFDMLDNPYEGQVVREMMKWRVDIGHSDEKFDSLAGKPLISQICNQELWSYEQDQFKEMYRYLYQKIPGAVLSALALILWVLTTMVEYRQITEQTLALMTLPTSKTRGLELRKSLEKAHKTHEGFEIQSIRHSHRIFAVVFISLPRLGVLIALCIVGCQYLAQTASLEDIVLNAVALSFVLDIDEKLCLVLLSQKLRSVLQSLQPLPCGTATSLINRRVGGFVLKDLLRYVIMAGAIMFAVFVYLVPFNSNVHGAAVALCGGETGFTFNGGTAAQPEITLKNTSSWAPYCGDDMMDDYVSRVYGVPHNLSVRTNRRTTTNASQYEQVRITQVYNFAFKGCDVDLVRDLDQNCRTMPTSLAGYMPSGVQPGRSVDPPPCPVLRPDDGWESCNSLPVQDSCLWEWGQQVCEGDKEPPGDIHEAACSNDLKESCVLWRHFLNREHPRLNCLILDYCSPLDLDCFAIQGTLELHLAKAADLRANGTLALFIIQNSLAKLAASSVYDVQVRFAGGFDSESDSTSQEVDFLLAKLEQTLKPYTLLNSTEKLTREINQGFAQELGSQGVISAVDITSHEFGDEDVLRATHWLEPHPP